MEFYLINKDNAVLDLLDKSRFVIKAEALHGVETEINETDSPYTDGTTVDGVKALPRGIELTFILRGNVEQSRQYIKSYIKSKQFVTLREVDGDKDITIKGVATINPYTRNERACKLSVSIYCNQPYWEDLNYIIEEISGYIDLLNFPAEGQYFTQEGRPFGALSTDLIKTFRNEGDVSVGMLLSMVALDTVVNPRISCSSGEQNGWYMQVNLALAADDELVINTVKGNKYITINGLETYNGEPIVDKLEFGGLDWLQLETGDNTFSVTTENATTNSNVYFNIIYKARYE